MQLQNNKLSGFCSKFISTIVTRLIFIWKILSKKKFWSLAIISILVSSLVFINLSSNVYPKPHSFCNHLLMSARPGRNSDPNVEKPWATWDTAAERKGVWACWRKSRENMCISEQLCHLQQDLDLIKDRAITTPQYNYIPQMLLVQKEMDAVRQPGFMYTKRSLAEIEYLPHPSGWNPINWPQAKSYIAVLITPFSVISFEFVIAIAGHLMILLVFLFAIFVSIIDPSFIPNIEMLTSKLPDFIRNIITGLSLALVFLIKLLLMIRRANNSKGSYDKLFNFISQNFSLWAIFFVIILLSSVLVYISEP